MNIPIFPTINAFLNLTAGIFLVCGWLAIRKKKQQLHKRFMIAAMFSSALFLVSYLSYHAMMHGVVTKYEGQGFSRILYFTILLTHTPLATLIVPFSIIAVRHGLKGQWDKHTRITRWLLPVWLYVSVTGVLIYVMLYICR